VSRKCLHAFSSGGSMWNELRMSSGVGMCCHETYERVELFHSENRRRYRLAPSSSPAPRRRCSDGGLVITQRSLKVTCWT